MEIIFLSAVLIALTWLDALTTYLFLKKAKDYGYPLWIREETSPVYRYFIGKYGLVRGLIAVAFINPLVFNMLAALTTITLAMSLDTSLALGLGFGVFYGMMIISINNNYFIYYKCPADRYNEKVLGHPKDDCRNGRPS
ncbi:hypothetical protein ACFLRF_01420 [Candidatus Altiarchaeota archaeon]